MGIIEAASLFIIMLTLAFIPSSSVALVVTRSMSHGVANGVCVSAGIVIGDLIFILLAVLGLSVIAETMGWLFVTVKYIGATYLIWLGYTLISTTADTTIDIGKTQHRGNLATSFFSGLLLTLGDIKAIFFYVSLFPAFVNLHALRLSDIAIIMIVTIITVGGAKIFYVLSAARIASLSREHKLESGTRKLTGSLMIGAGGYLILKS